MCAFANCMGLRNRKGVSTAKRPPAHPFIHPHDQINALFTSDMLLAPIDDSRVIWSLAMVNKRFPASFFVVAAIVVIPTILYQLVQAAENADSCELRAIASKVTGAKPQLAKGLVCSE